MSARYVFSVVVGEEVANACGEQLNPERKDIDKALDALRDSLSEAGYKV